ncbi:putative RNA-directed DNA polymerase from transposon BS [Trichonephila clavipes]|nr:putative RNA-directed DNA polymerase from transposon BS [Trichonephila clavipes]
MIVTDCSSIPELSSDHNPVLFEVSLDNYTSPALSSYSFPNWSKFQEILTNSLPGNPRISNPNDIENAVKNFNDCYNNSLESSFQENPEPYDDDFINHVEERVDNFLNHNSRCHTATLTSPQEIMDIILQLPNKKAPGKDGI